MAWRWLAWRRLGLLLGRTPLRLLIRVPGLFLLPLPLLLPLSGLQLRLSVSLHLPLCGAGLSAGSLIPAAAAGRGPERPASAAELVLLRQSAGLLPLCAELWFGLARSAGTAPGRSERRTELGNRSLLQPPPITRPAVVCFWGFGLGQHELGQHENFNA